MVLPRLLTVVAALLTLGTPMMGNNLHTAVAESAVPASSQPALVLPQELQSLQLTPQQMQQLQMIQSKYKDQLIQQRQQLRQAQHGLENAMLKGAPETEIRTQYRQVQTQKQQLEELRFEVTLAVHNLLTPQQRQMLVTLSRQRLANMARQLKSSQPSPQAVPPQK